MKRFLVTCIILLFSTGYVLLLNYYTESRALLQKITTLLIAALLIILIIFPFFIKKIGTGYYSKYIMLFVSSIFLQLVIISTGGIISPLFILVHLFTIAVGFVFNFSIAILYLTIVILGIFADLLLSQNFSLYLIDGSPVFILQLASIIPILPITYIISQEYYLKKKLAEKLDIQLKTDQTIFKNLKELIIITDPRLSILSVNDTVERILQISRFDLVKKNIFEILLLKDSYGHLVNESTFFTNDNKDIKKYKNEFTLFRSNMPFRKIQIRIKPTLDIEGTISQYSFIISSDITSDDVTNIEESRAKYEALIEEIKNNLNTDNMRELKTKVIILEKIEHDMHLMHELESNPHSGELSRIDLAKLCRQAVDKELEFARALQISIDFLISDFTLKDIEPLTIKSYPVAPSDLTGPFFTVSSDVTFLEIYLEKMIDLSIIIASNIDKGRVDVSIKRQGRSAFKITISASCPALTQDEYKVDLFRPYFGNLNAKLNLVRASGLEGYLVKLLKNELNINLDLDNTNNTLILTSIIKSR